MEVSLRFNSSFGVGLLAGITIGTLFSCQLKINGKKFLDFHKKLFGNKFVKNCCSTDGNNSCSNELVVKNESKDMSEEERAPERDAFWFKEGLTPAFRVEVALKQILFDARSDFQRVQVIETEQFGRTLVMDGQTQSAIADEHIYHESLVHPAMLLHENPKSVFIGGGGEFATAREVLRHSSVERCVMIDIDKVACDICREQLPEWNGGAYEDPRFHVEYLDAKGWLEDNDEKFDVIIMDICDPIEAGPGYKLYTQDFYEYLVKEKLNPGGIFVTQSGPGAVYNAKEECFTVINRTLRSAFDIVTPYAVDIPSFGCNWGFNVAFCKSSKTSFDILNTDIDEFNQAIEKRIMGGSKKLRFLDGTSFRGMMGMPKEIRLSCEEEDRIMTIDNPVFMYAA